MNKQSWPNFLLTSMLCLIAVGGYSLCNYLLASDDVKLSQENKPSEVIKDKTLLAPEQGKSDNERNQMVRLQQALTSKQQVIDQLRYELKQLRSRLNDIENGSPEFSGDEPLLIEANQTGDELIFSENNLALLEQTLYGETPDTEWSEQAISDIQDALAVAELEGSELIAVDCAATLCRVQTRQDDIEAAEVFLNVFPTLIGWDANAYAGISDDSSGAQSVIYFISREGHRLPIAQI